MTGVQTCALPIYFLEDAQPRLLVANAAANASVQSAVQPAVQLPPHSPGLTREVQATTAGVPGTTAAQAAAAPQTLEDMEIAAIRSAVEAAGGNISEASKRLGVSRNTIYRKLRWNQGA